MKFSINDFFSKCDQIRRKLWIWSHLLKKSLMENFHFLCSGHQQFFQHKRMHLGICKKSYHIYMINPFHATGLFPYLLKWGYRNQAGIYLFKANNRNTRTMCEICSKLTIKSPERRHLRSSGVFIVNFAQISHIVLVFLLLTLSK